MEYSFSAPTEDLELNLVNYCLDSLNLEFGEFWYQWFPAHNRNNNNQTINIDCNIGNLVDKIKSTFSEKFVSVVKFHKIQVIPLPDYYDQKFRYIVHFKSVDKL